MKPIIGLFGTCGGSKWRDDFIRRYKRLDISFYNPQKDDWKPEDAQEEAEHLLKDDIILFPVTGETFGFGSLGETGFSILATLTSGSNRFVVIFIDPELDADLVENYPKVAKDAKNARSIVLAHLAKVSLPNVYVVNDLTDMLVLSLELYKVCEMLNKISEKR